MLTNLFLPFKIGKLEIKNRFVRSATWDATADASGTVTDNSLDLYRNLGKGGVGLVISGYAFVSADGQAVHGQYGVHDDSMIPGLRRMVDVVHQGGPKIALQIVHSGVNSTYLRQRNLTPLAVSSTSEITYAHREMTEEDIDTIIADFTLAAVRAKEAGFDAVQLHGAHSYLMNQFLSPLYNQRTDRWGGSLENRSRFHLEVIQRMRKTLGVDFPLMIKFGVQDEKEGGLTLNEGIETAQKMAEKGIDAIEVSAGIGTTSSQVLIDGELERPYFRERASTVKKAVAVPIIVVGGIRTLETAADIIDSGDADLISMSRPFIREPDLISRWKMGKTEAAHCISCNLCFGPVRKGELLECVKERQS